MCCRRFRRPPAPRPPVHSPRRGFTIGKFCPGPGDNKLSGKSFCRPIPKQEIILPRNHCASLQGTVAGRNIVPPATIAATSASYDKLREA